MAHNWACRAVNSRHIPLVLLKPSLTDPLFVAKDACQPSLHRDESLFSGLKLITLHQKRADEIVISEVKRR